MPISPTSSIVNMMAAMPVQGPAATGPASPAIRAAEAALAAKQALQQQSQAQTPAVPSLSAEAHKAVANLPRGSFLDIVV